MTDGIRNARNGRWLVYILLPLAGWFGAEILSPGARMTRLEAEVKRETVRMDAHLIWAIQRNDLLEALARLKCLENWDNPAARQLLEAAKLPCGVLLGNRIGQ